MSSLDHKLREPDRVIADRARARLEQLRERWGCTSKKGERAPDEVVVDQLVTGRKERWRLVDGTGHGEQAFYELVEVFG